MGDIESILADDAKLTQITTAIFNEVDEDGSGEIDRDELKLAITKLSGDAGIDPPSDFYVDEVLKTLDTDNSGTVDVNEFKVLIYEVLKTLT
jgi:Ca2+-binding EF-hand superfamily protein